MIRTHSTNQTMKSFQKMVKIRDKSHINCKRLSKMEINSIKIVVFLFCVMGSGYQLIETSHLFFRYETTTNVNFETTTVTDLPGLTLCAYKSHFLRSDHFVQRFGHKKNSTLSSTESDQILEYLNSMSIKDQFKALMTAEELLLSLNSCKTLGPHGTNISCELVSPLKLSIDGKFYCFTLFSEQHPNQTQHKDYISHVIRFEYDFLYLVVLELPRWIDSMVILMHPKEHRVVKLLNTDLATLDFTEMPLKVFNYKETTIRRLPKPYSTDCKDYTKTGFISSEDCLVKCKIKYSMQNMKPISFLYLMDDQNSDLHFRPRTETYDESAGRMCREKCGQQKKCFQRYYELIQYEWNGLTNENLIKVRVPFKPRMYYKQTPRIQVDEFLCYIASISNLWFGFSIVMFWKVIQRIINYVLKFKIKLFVKKFFVKRVDLMKLFVNVEHKHNSIYLKNSD